MIGQLVSHYRILEQVGKGGMGVVYKAEDTRLHRTVALKFLNTELLLDESEKARFEHEAEAAAQLGHPNIATVYDFEEFLDPGTATRHAFIAMEFVDGESLKQKIARSPLPFEEVASIAHQLASALQAAHQKGIVHRDVKPANIIARHDGSIKVLDFGVAKLAGETRVTAAGHIVGSIAYMSPEQLQGGDVDLRSDIWSFGVVLYEILTQRFPFRGDHAAAVVYSITNEDPVPLESVRANVPPSLAATCIACLAKHREERPESMAVVLSMLEGIPTLRPEKLASSKRILSTWSPAVTIPAIAVLIAAALFIIPGIRTGIERFFSGPAGGQKILVVLPFTPIDSCSECQSFCCGLSWMVPSRLAELTRSEGGISLVGARDVSTYRVKNSEDARKVLGASLVVTGAMQRIGDIFRLTVDLLDASSNRQLDSRFGTYAATGYTAMENDAIQHIVAMLGLHVQQISADANRKGTADDEAYRFYAQGRGYLQQYQKTENLRIASDLFKKAIQRDSSFAQAHAGLGEACWRVFEATNETLWIPRARAEAERAITLKPTLPEAHVTMGIVHSGTGLYEQAVKDFENTIALDPTSTDAYRGLARAYNNLGKFAEAESTYKQAITLNSNYWAGYNHLGYFYSTRGRYEEAAAQFTKVTELTPDNVRGYDNLGAMYIYLQRWSDAAAALERAMKLAPTYVTYSLLGAAYFYQENYHAASRTYLEALRIDSSDYRIWGSLAASQYWTPGERERSMASYRHAVASAEIMRRVDPRDVDVLSHLATFHAALGNKQRALTLVEQSLRGAKNAPEVLTKAAETYQLIGERSKALENLEGALEAGVKPEMLQNNPVLKDFLGDEKIHTLIERRGVKKQ
jgi:serine/threonine protein kinase/tetratricopeptide (TPR) repeat protein